MQSKYEVLGIVGEGAYGKVFKCKNKENGEFVAMKQFKEVEDDLVKKTMARELKVLQMLKHENIVEFKEAFKRKGNLFLVFEYVEKNLLELLQEQPKGLDPSVIKKLIYQICLAIKYLHDMNIVHRDIKPENLLVHDNLKLKLCDFGFARTIKTSREKLTDYVATRWYRSPELLLSAGFYGPEVDYWAIGCIMGELADGDPLFDGSNEIDQILVIQKVLGKLPDYQIELFYGNPHFKGAKLHDVPKPETLERRYMGKLSKQAISFMKALLNPDPKQRLKGDAVFQHPYFENYTNPFPQQISLNIENQNKHSERKNNQNSINNINLIKNENNNHVNEINANLIVTNENQTLHNSNFNTTQKNIIDNNSPSINHVNIPIQGTTNINIPIDNKKMKTGAFQPIISNMTNINIINYNNFDGTNIMKNKNAEKFLSQQQNLNSKNFFLNFDSEKFGNKTFNNTNHLGEKNKNNLMSSNKIIPNKNMVLTSYNFNQNLKDNILSLYTSTTFDKNFKTFYKGDPYNFDIDMNFVNQKNRNKQNENKKNFEIMSQNSNNYNTNEEEKFKKTGYMNTKKMNQTASSDKMYLSSNNFNTTNNLNGKKKAKVSLHEKLKPTTNVIYEENYQINSKVIPLKFPGLKINSNNLKSIYAKDFHLPSINSKGFSVVKKMGAK